MTSFLTLTPNPALDIATSTEQVLPTHKLRCGTVLRYPGGGGINVARVLHRLGAAVEARALVGGPAGAQLQALLQQEGVACQMHAIAGDTRENMSVLETRTGQEFRFVLPGPTVDHTQSQALLEALLPTAEPGSQPARWIIASGSLPPGMPHDFYAQLAHAAQQQGVPLALDTSGAALAAALEVGVALVKPSLRELRDLLQRPLNTVQECGDAAFTLVQQGAASTVAVSMGELAPCWPTATAYGTHQRLRCRPPPAPPGRAIAFWRPWSGRWNMATHRPRPCAGAWPLEPPPCCRPARPWPRPQTSTACTPRCPCRR